MADKKPPVKKDYFVEVVFLLFMFAIVLSVLNMIARFFGRASFVSLTNSGASFFSSVVWPVIKAFSFIITAAAIVGISHAFKKLKAINDAEKEIYNPVVVSVSDDHVYLDEKNEKWEHIVGLINSPNQSDWRLAIIEADIILEELLRAAGYHGDSIGDMLKSVEVSDFLTIDHAWKGHRVRNNIAHAGSDFMLNERMAKETIAHYEMVFKEFKII
jgi:hypothetical protein